MPCPTNSNYQIANPKSTLHQGQGAGYRQKGVEMLVMAGLVIWYISRSI